MAEKIAFTKTTLAAVTCPAGKDRVYVYDTKTPGLAFCATEKGAQSFYLYRWANGRPSRTRIGGYPDISIEQARNQAAQLNGDIARGVDPQERKRLAKLGATFGELFDRYMETHAKVHKKSWRDDQAQFDRYLTSMKGRDVASIRKSDVQALHTRVGKEHGHYAANRLLSLLHAVFSKCGVVNPAHGIQRFKEKQRERFLQADELAPFFKALAVEPNQVVRDFILIALLTGARRGNVQAMKWDELHLERATWTIPDTKAGTSLTLPLAPQAVQILEHRQAIANGSPYVFPARHGESGHLTEPKAAWQAILTRAGIKDLRVHDLRRTLGSWQAAAGASLPIIGKSLGHKNHATTAIYARLSLDPVRASVNAAADAMLAVANPGPKTKPKATVKKTTRKE